MAGVNGDIADSVNSHRLSDAELPFPAELLGKGGSPRASEAIVYELLAAHPADIEAFRGGKADPKLANKILSTKLKA